jgi:pantetheine-phosphate adenylyltransferase
MKKTAVFPGSFDPVTRGHESIVERAIPLFDQLIVAIGDNTAKKSLFSIRQRMAWLNDVFGKYPSVKVIGYKGLTVDLCRKMKAPFILRGLRTSADFEFERSIAQVNKVLYPDIETVFLLTLPEFASLTSSTVREIITYGGDPSRFIPEEVDVAGYLKKPPVK